MQRTIKDYNAFCRWITRFTFGDAYEQTRKFSIDTGTPYSYGMDMLDDIFGNQFATSFPSLGNALQLITEQTTLYFDDEWLLKYSTFHLSPSFARAVAYSCDDQNASQYDDDPSKTFYNKWMLSVALNLSMHRLEDQRGLMILNRVKSMLQLSTTDAVGNIDIAETSTPRVETTVSNSSNFKSTTDDEASVYGFNSSSAVKVSEGKSTTSGIDTENSNTMTTTHLGQDDFTRKGFDGKGNLTKQIVLAQQLDALKHEALDYVLGQFRDYLFTI